VSENHQGLDALRRINERQAAHRATWDEAVAHAGERLEQTEPLPQETYVDHGGRVLLVESVHLGDPAGREVRGLVTTGRADPLGRTLPSVAHPYACSLTWWARTWRDTTPPTPRERQTHGA
jgi:hypothetical protein